MDGKTYTSRVSANSVVASYVYTQGIPQARSLHSVLKRSYIAAVCDKCFRIVGIGVYCTISVDIPSETSWDDLLVGLHMMLACARRENSWSETHVQS